MHPYGPECGKCRLSEWNLCRDSSHCVGNDAGESSLATDTTLEGAYADHLAALSAEGTPLDLLPAQPPGPLVSLLLFPI